MDRYLAIIPALDEPDATQLAAARLKGGGLLALIPTAFCLALPVAAEQPLPPLEASVEDRALEPNSEQEVIRRGFVARDSRGRLYRRLGDRIVIVDRNAEERYILDASTKTGTVETLEPWVKVAFLMSGTIWGASVDGEMLESEAAGLDEIEGILVTHYVGETTMGSGSLRIDQWQSEELGTLLGIIIEFQTRDGSMPYRRERWLSDLRVSEPDPELFTVPADYILERIYFDRPPPPELSR